MYVLNVCEAMYVLYVCRPRRQAHYPNGMGINSPLLPVLEEPHNFSLYHTNRKLTLEHKVYRTVPAVWSQMKSVFMCYLVLVQITINARVVVVGASDTALACLESLVFWCVCVCALCLWVCLCMCVCMCESLYDL